MNSQQTQTGRISQVTSGSDAITPANAELTFPEFNGEAAARELRLLRPYIEEELAEHRDRTRRPTRELLDTVYTI